MVRSRNLDQTERRPWVIAQVEFVQGRVGPVVGLIVLCRKARRDRCTQRARPVPPSGRPVRGF